MVDLGERAQIAWAQRVVFALFAFFPVGFLRLKVFIYPQLR